MNPNLTIAMAQARRFELLEAARYARIAEDCQPDAAMRPSRRRLLRVHFGLHRHPAAVAGAQHA